MCEQNARISLFAKTFIRWSLTTNTKLQKNKYKYKIAIKTVVVSCRAMPVLVKRGMAEFWRFPVLFYSRVVKKGSGREYQWNCNPKFRTLFAIPEL